MIRTASVPDILPPDKFPKLGNISVFPVFRVFLGKKEKSEKRSCFIRTALTGGLFSGRPQLKNHVLVYKKRSPGHNPGSPGEYIPRILL